MRNPRAHFVAFATPEYALSLELSVEGARPYFESIRTWDREELKTTQFYRDNREILDQPRGAGYWLWKPYIIRERLREIPEGDILMYLDAGARIIADPTPLFEIAERVEIMVFAGHYAGRDGVPYRCAQWTKRDCFVLMGCDSPEYHQARMLDASILLVKNGPRAVAFIDEWLRYASVPEIVTDQPNTCGMPNLEAFVDHRHDQSILSMLATRYGLQLFAAPSALSKYGFASADRRNVCTTDARSSSSSDPLQAMIVDHHRIKTSDNHPGAAPRCYLDALIPAHRQPSESRRILQVGEPDANDVGHATAQGRMAELFVLRRPSDAAEWRRLTGTAFDVVFCSARGPAAAAPVGLFELFLHSLLASEFVVYWTDLVGTRAFKRSTALLRAQFGPSIASSLAIVRRPYRGSTRMRIEGVLYGTRGSRGADYWSVMAN